MSEGRIVIATKSYTLGEWASSGRLATAPPHYLGHDPRHANELGVIWADKDHRTPLAVEDWDGCRAAIVSPIPPERRWLGDEQ